MIFTIRNLQFLSATGLKVAFRDHVPVRMKIGRDFENSLTQLWKMFDAKCLSWQKNNVEDNIFQVKSQAQSVATITDKIRSYTN